MATDQRTPRYPGVLERRGRELARPAPSGIGGDCRIEGGRRATIFTDSSTGVQHE